MVNSSLIQFRALLARQHALHQQHHRRLASRLHDEVSQKLTLLSLQFSLAGLEPKPPANWTQKCDNWNSIVLELGTILRDVSNELCPRILDELGIVAALQWFAESCPEIVTDVFAPIGVTEVSIELEQTANLLRIKLGVQTVKPGSDPLTVQALDALSIHERLACVDGAAEVDQQPGRGFAVTLSAQTSRRTVCAAA